MTKKVLMAARRPMRPLSSKCLGLYVVYFYILARFPANVASPKGKTVPDAEEVLVHSGGLCPM
ncbi:MAG: hypothetical protein M1133_07130, partial [Armatimonadetes bacterium]|nr:hypothetical protein [Armatimonadota bacterium]